MFRLRPDTMPPRPRSDKMLNTLSILKPDKKLLGSKAGTLPSGIIPDKGLVPDEAALAEAAVNDTTNKIASKTLAVFLILSKICFPTLLHSPQFHLIEYNLKTLNFQFAFHDNIKSWNLLSNTYK